MQDGYTLPYAIVSSTFFDYYTSLLVLTEVKS